MDTAERDTEVRPAHAEESEASDEWGEDLKNASIVMIDDEETTLEIIEMFLEDAGYRHFAGTKDSRSAMDLIRQTKPDVVLLDMSMPHVDGLTILRAIRAEPSLREIPVIILSATDSDTKLEALASGAADFLTKPVNPSELVIRLRNTLAAKAYQHRLAYYDGLTGLPNRKLFIERMAAGLVGDEEQVECGLLQVGLDRFKQLNDTLGRFAGDQILVECVSRLQACIRSTDAAAEGLHQEVVLSRVGGDEFAIFLPGLDSIDRSARLARRVISALADPFHVEGNDLVVTAGVGAALSPSDGDDCEVLMRKAGVAMSHAKQVGRNHYQFYSDSLNEEVAERLRLENDLRRAIDEKELSLAYQPKIALQTGEVVAVEVLMRWTHPELGPIPPDRFIPVAEDSGLIVELGEWALRTACQQAKSWQDAGLPQVRIAVNLSSQQFRPGLVKIIRDALDSSGLEARHLVLELTESLLMEDPEEAVAMLTEIEELGPKLSIDDFGTGYSSLAYLKRFPVSELKIDRSFVTGLPDDQEGGAIVTAIIALAHSLGLSVVAEGIETQEHLEFLKERGCDEGQGYLFSRPIPPSEWPALMERASAGE